jgi:transcriptional regulator with XRE-family HTH domain
MLRELKGLTQKEPAKRCKINATNISLLENNKLEIGKKNAERLAQAFNVHPAIIMFPEYESEENKRRHSTSLNHPRPHS